MSILNLIDNTADRAALPGQSATQSRGTNTHPRSLLGSSMGSSAWASLSRQFASSAMNLSNAAMTQQAAWLASPADRARKQRILKQLQLQVAILSIAADVKAAKQNP